MVEGGRWKVVRLGAGSWSLLNQRDTRSKYPDQGTTLAVALFHQTFSHGTAGENAVVRYTAH